MNTHTLLSSVFDPSAIDIDGLGIPLPLQAFPPTYAAAVQRMSAISPTQYARTRNALDGAVTGLSPYLTHGIIAVPEVAQRVAMKHTLGYSDKLVFELGWREYFHHVWSRVDPPDAVLHDMRPARLWSGRYSPELPADIAQGRTGVPAIDSAVRQLYATGYLHNHARMWLASYCVHARKVHWRAGADWLYAHLLDGDLPSNHLSWQWVAATFSAKPYLFNAANVAKYAPRNAWKAWVSANTAIDVSYEEMDTLARVAADVGPEPGNHSAVAVPSLAGAELATYLLAQKLGTDLDTIANATERIRTWIEHHPGGTIELVHPWALAEPESGPSDQRPLLRIGIVHAQAHTALPWNARRWHFVLTRMRAVCEVLWIGDVKELARIPGWPRQTLVRTTHTLYAGYRDVLPQLAQVRPERTLFSNPQTLCHSFSRFYDTVQRAQPDFSKLLTIPRQADLL